MLKEAVAAALVILLCLGVSVMPLTKVYKPVSVLAADKFSTEDFDNKDTETSNEIPKAIDQQYISWMFTVYTEPSFTADRVYTFSPQTVTVIDRNEDGWALISTYSGNYWAYTRENRIYVDRKMFLFDNIGDRDYVSTLAPQTIRIIEQRDNWCLISTWLGDKWINLSFTPPNTELASFIKKYNNTVSVYYENLETGYAYCYNADRLYFSASIIKAPYALYVYNLAESKQTDFGASHTYTSGNYRGGTGITQNMQYGTRFTEYDLLKYAIRNSDNVAFNMLLNKYGADGFKEFIAELGGNTDILSTVGNANLNANEAGLYAREIYRYIESDSIYGAQFKTDLMNTSNPMIRSDYPIARKYGWATRSFHDMSIVYAKSPYVLVIMSDREWGYTRDFEAFRAISMEVQRFNDKWFVD